VGAFLGIDIGTTKVAATLVCAESYIQLETYSFHSYSHLDTTENLSEQSVPALLEAVDRVKLNCNGRVIQQIYYELIPYFCPK